MRRFRGGGFDPKEPLRVADAVKRMGLKFVVITSVTRDDLELGGAFQFHNTVKAIKRFVNHVKVEVLVPDFKGSKEAVEMVVNSNPDVFSHNVETVPRLYSKVRRGADYLRSLKVLEYAKEINDNLITKSALILGFGETLREIEEVMEDLRSVGCDVLSIGQYYSPSLRHHPVVKFYKKEEFEYLERIAYSKGFKLVFSGPNVRSSYMAHRTEALL